jgi:hypothetical protein
MAQALRIAHAANDRAFGGRILAAMSHQALHLGDVRHGLDFACAARAGTQGLNRPGIDGGSDPWRGWSHVSPEEVSPRAS